MTQADVIRKQRLARIEAGDLKPRLHRPDEVEAWERGHNARQSVLATLSVAFLVAGGLYLALNQKNPPAANPGAFAMIVEGKR